MNPAHKTIPPPAEAEAVYRAHLEAAAQGRFDEKRRRGRAYRGMLRALDTLPARRLSSDLERGQGTVWVWSDLHLGHANIIRYANRPFADADEMDRRLLANWGSVVGPEDALVLVGDVAMGRAIAEGIWWRIRSCPGRYRHLVVGNHDLTRAGELLVEGFDEVCSLLWADGDPPLLFTHVPLAEVPHGWVNVHGHVHDSPVTRSPHINVSVEHLRYRPLALPRIRALAKELSQGTYPEGTTTLERIEEIEGGRVRRRGAAPKGAAFNLG